MIRFGRRYSNAISNHNFARSRSLTNLNGRRHCARTLATTSQGIQLKEKKKKTTTAAIKPGEIIKITNVRNTGGGVEGENGGGRTRRKAIY